MSPTDGPTRADVMRMTNWQYSAYQRYVGWLRSMVDTLDRQDRAYRFTHDTSEIDSVWWQEYRLNLRAS